jgi:Lar family restriction alleviation protein
MPKPTNDPELKRCPFCGSAELEFARTNASAAWVTCSECDASAGSASSRQEAIAHWNRRAADGARTDARFIYDDEEEA